MSQQFADKTVIITGASAGGGDLKVPCLRALGKARQAPDPARRSRHPAPAIPGAPGSGLRAILEIGPM